MRIWLFLIYGTALAANSYHTTFPLTENPISEGSKWINGGTTGLDWKNAQTTTNKVFGTQVGNESCPSNCNDTTAVLTGSWGATQTAQATIYSTGGLTAFSEVELRLRTTITANSITGYEFICSVIPGNQYAQIVRWNGTLGNFTLLNSTGTGCASGDILKATASGSTLAIYKNGTQIFSLTDATYTGGSPGVGFFLNGQTGVDANFGFTDFWATDGVPVVDTTTVSSVTSSGAASGGTVVNNGGSSVTAEGVVCGTSTNPTTVCTSDGTSTPFTSTITGQPSSTLIYVRSYATNSNGTGYGPNLTFTTSAAANAAVYAGGIIE